MSFSENALGLSGDDWWYINKAWLDGAIDANVPVILVSRGDKTAKVLKLALKTGKDTGLTKEIRHLMLRNKTITLRQ